MLGTRSCRYRHQSVTTGHSNCKITTHEDNRTPQVHLHQLMVQNRLIEGVILQLCRPAQSGAVAVLSTNTRVTQYRLVELSYGF